MNEAHSELLTMRQAADALGISLSTVYSVVLVDLPTVRVGRRRLVTRAALAAWMARHTQAGTTTGNRVKGA